MPIYLQKIIQIGPFIKKIYPNNNF